MTRRDFDLVVIGGGSGGLTAARFAAWLGARVLLVERARLGGDCLYTGCVPSKALIRSAGVVHLMRTAHAFGLDPADPQIDLARVMASTEEVIKAVAQADSRQALEKDGVQVAFGEAAFQSRNSLSIGSEVVRSKRFLIATGSSPARPNIEGLGAVPSLTTDDVFSLKQLPPRLLVLGGGPVAVELGQAFQRLGSKVSLVEKMNRLLPREDGETSAVVERSLAAEGVEIFTSSEVTAFEAGAGAGLATLATDAGEQSSNSKIEFDQVLVAVGRSPMLSPLNLERAGVTFSSGGIGVDEYMRTSAANIYACGDVVGPPHFTHLAGYQGAMAARNALLPGKQKAVPDALPAAIFTDPEVASVGLTEDAAREKGLDYVTATLPLHEVDSAQTRRSTHGFIKLLTRKNGKLLGAHLVGPGASEAIQEYVLAIHKGMKAGDLAMQVHPYPTLATGSQTLQFRSSLARWSSGGVQGLLRKAIVKATLLAG